MNYIRLKQALKDFTVFTIPEIKKIDPRFYRRRLTEWQDKGYIRKVIKGHYVFADLKIDEQVLFEIANRIYRPSYVSFETALAYHGFTPESVYEITSASTRKTRRFQTPFAGFTYRSLGGRIFFGYELVSYRDKRFKMALPEKAVLDYLYANPRLNREADFKSLRFNGDVFFEKIKEATFHEFLKKFAQKSLAKRFHTFWRCIRHA